MMNKSEEFKKWHSERMGHPESIKLAKAAIDELEEELLEKSWRCFSDSRPEEAEGNVVLGFGSEGIQEYEYQDEVWCCITGDTMTHWMPMIESPLQAS